MPTLTSRRHRQTRIDIATIAADLFARDGYDDTTMDDVATAAGVSRRTVYRHFSHKHELMFFQPYLWLEHFNEVVGTRKEGESTRDVCRRGVLSVAEVIQEFKDTTLVGWGVLQQNPSLRGHQGHTQDMWVERYGELIMPDVMHRPDGLLDAATMAGTLVAATNALVLVWALGQPDADMPTLTAVAIDKIDPLWPKECR